jgi:hypothetical protein
MKKLLLIICLITLPMSIQAMTWQASSGKQQAAVIELYTAEGCGLCPAADKWIEHRIEQHSSSNLIVLGFHVDYLNEQKAWVDRFAKPAFTARQKQMARINLYQTVFTPEFFMGGEVLHDWQKHGDTVIDYIQTLEPEAHIQLHAERNEQQLKLKTDVTVMDADNQPHAKLYLALTENNVRNEIRGGDNIGAVFNHQNLVRAWLGPFELDASGHSVVETTIPIEKEWDWADLSVKAFVQNLDNGYVLQGVALPLNSQ